MNRHFRAIRTFINGGIVIAALLWMSQPLAAQVAPSSEGEAVSSGDQNHRSQINFLATRPFQEANSAVDSSGNSLTNSPTRSAGFMFSYDFKFNKWLRMEAGWAASRNSQRYMGSSGFTELQGDMNQLTIEGQVAIPLRSTRITPFALGGIGAVKFAPTDFTKGNIPEAQSQSNFGTVFGGGADIAIGRGIGFRAEYRVLISRSPTFDLPEFGTSDRLIVHEPVMGLFWRF